MKKKDTMTGVTMSGLIGLNVVGAMPSAAGDAGIRAGYATGVSNIGNALPTVGKIKGTNMVLKSIGKIKPIKMKGGRNKYV